MQRMDQAKTAREITENQQGGAFHAQGEEWRSIEGFPGYEISNLGNVRTWRVRGSAKKIALHPALVTPRVVKGGYLRVKLHRDNDRFYFFVNRLVAATFIGPLPDGMQVCHRNGIRTDNRPENLRYDTPKGNQQDRKGHGTWPCGEKNANCKLTTEQVIEIRRRYKPRVVTKKMLASEYGVHPSYIGLIIHRRCWKGI